MTLTPRYLHFSNLGRGRVLRTWIKSPTYAASYFDPRGAQDLWFPLPQVPYLKLAAVHDEEVGTLTLFALNRSLTEEMPLRVNAEGFSGLVVEQALQLHDTDLKAVNIKANPDRVKPSALASVRAEGHCLTATLLPASWNVIRVIVS